MPNAKMYIPPEVLEEAKSSVAAGETWYSAAKRLGYNYVTLRQYIDPVWAARYYARTRGRHQKPRRPKNLPALSWEALNGYQEPLKEEQQFKPKTPNQYWLGDPPPGRSALDLKASYTGAH